MRQVWKRPLPARIFNVGAVGKGAMKWTDPVVAQLPSFALADPYVTAHVTYADLFWLLSIGILCVMPLALLLRSSASLPRRGASGRGTTSVPAGSNVRAARAVRTSESGDTTSVAGPFEFLRVPLVCVHMQLEFHARGLRWLCRVVHRNFHVKIPSFRRNSMERIRRVRAPRSIERDSW